MEIGAAASEIYKNSHRNALCEQDIEFQMLNLMIHAVITGH
jgi:hypothetical protein